MLDLTGYTVAGNETLNRARILWNPITGTVSGDGETPELAANDFPFQRWSFDAYPAEWTIETASDADVDTLFIAAHNLGSVGTTVTVATSATVDGSFTTRAVVTPTDNGTIAVMFNNSGAPYVVRRVRLTVSDGAGLATVGVIRAGVALQMQRPFFGGHQPVLLNEDIDVRDNTSETGQWLGRIVQRRAYITTMRWSHLRADWVRQTFEPFRRVAIQRPFGVIENPIRMPEGVVWAWTDSIPQPTNMGVRDYMEASLPIRGLYS